MPVSAIYRIDKLVAGSSFTLQASENQTPTPGIQSMIESAAGEGAPNFIATDRTAPSIGFSTKQLATLLGAVGSSGLAISGNTDLYYKLATTTGNVARATASHQRIRAASAIAYWSRVTLPGSGAGSADVMICPVYDGSNEPFVYAGSTALSGSIAASALAYFVCGPVYINGSQLGAIQEITIESGAREIPEYSDGEHHPTFRRIDSIAPVITIKTISASGWSSPGPAGLALDGADGIVAYGRKIAQNGTRVADATTEHLSFTGLNGRAILVDSRGTGTGAVEDTIRVELSRPDDTTAILSVSVAAAIP